MNQRGGTRVNQVVRSQRHVAEMRRLANRVAGSMKDIERIVRFFADTDIYGAVELSAEDVEQWEDVRDFLALALADNPQGIEVLVRARQEPRARQAGREEHHAGIQHQAARGDSDLDGDRDRGAQGTTTEANGRAHERAREGRGAPARTAA